MNMNLVQTVNNNFVNTANAENFINDMKDITFDPNAVSLDSVAAWLDFLIV